ncbi:MAG TPA: alpha/beta hydrolase [Gemmatimonadales bacterium]|nr:alpha/beta hydrolase [Gemmatimonadales bacterium]
MIWTIMTAAGLYLALLVLLWFAQSHLIFFPGNQRTLVPPAARLGLQPERVAFTTDDGVQIVGWVMPAAQSANGFWLLICHGNAGNLSEFERPAHYAALRDVGLNLLAFDYRGYGESGGTASEQGLYRDADAAYRYLTEERGVPASRIILFGHSLGSAVAIDLASRSPAAGLIVEGALTSTVNRGQELYPFIPVRLLARSRFSSIDKVARIRIPKLFLHATRDEVIPVAHGRRLFQAAAEPKKFVELDGMHSDAFAVDSARYFGSVADFLSTIHSSVPSNSHHEGNK